MKFSKSFIILITLILGVAGFILISYKIDINKGMSEPTYSDEELTEMLGEQMILACEEIKSEIGNIENCDQLNEEDRQACYNCFNGKIYETIDNLKELDKQNGWN